MPDESQSSRRGRWKILLQFGVSALAVWLIARRVDLRESAHLVAGARAGYVVAAIALYVVGQVLSAYRWRLIGVSVGLVDSFAHYVRYYFIGMFFMFFGPSTLGGDLVRSLYLAEGAGGRVRAFNSVLFDRLNGLVVLVAIGASVESAAMGGGCDANVLNRRGFEVANLGTGMQKIHTVHEWLRVSDMARTAAVITEMVRLRGAGAG